MKGFEPYCTTEPVTRRRLTLLDCQLGSHTGHFSITRVDIAGRLVWACDECLGRRAAA